MLTIARQLIVEEQRTKESPETEAEAAIRVCNKLGRALSGLMGVNGYRSLITRALSRAAGESAVLAGVTVGADGKVGWEGSLESKAKKTEAAKGGVTLVGQLLELLVTFIGEAMTLRLVQQVWPKAALREDGKMEGKA